MSPVSIDSSNHADVIVVGAGILGTFHAYFTARKGYKTLLLERNAWPTDASTRNFGMIVQTIVEAKGEWAAFARASRELYLELRQKMGLAVRQTGSMYIASTEVEQRVLQEFAQMYAATYPCSYLEAAEARRRYPFLQASYCKGTLLFPDDLVVEPQRLLKQLISYINQTEQVSYRPYTTVVAIERTGQRCLVRDAAGNNFTADRVFVCSGAEYRTLFPACFVHSGLKVCKLQMLQTVVQPGELLPHAILSGLSIQRYPGFSSCPSYHRLQEQPVAEDLRNYGIHLLFKQDEDGSIILGDSHQYRAFNDASSSEEYTEWQINEAILHYGQGMLSLPSWHIQRMWNGYYLIHPQREVYTETIDHAIHIVTGIGGKGMSTGPGFSCKHVDSVLI